MIESKVLVEVYVAYGKNSGDELSDYCLTNNSPVSIHEALDSLGFNEEDTYDSIEDFINRKIDIIHCQLDGGDWDDPTGCYFTISTENELLEVAKKEYDKEVERIKGIFR